jgi:putative transposase
MLLSHKSSVKLNDSYSNIIGHMCYAAYKLWNVCNYERIHHKGLSLPVEYPDWYYQKKAHKDDLWYKQLPSQTAQEVCKLLDKGWKSFYTLQETHGVVNPNPPKFKHGLMPVTYMQNGLKHDPGSDVVRLSIPKQLKEFMSANYQIHEKYLFLKNKIFKDMDKIKQIRIYPPVKGRCDIIAIYEEPETEVLPDNGNYLSIDLGLHNLFTCYDASAGSVFILGRKYLSICHYYNKEIARVQSQWSVIQSRKKVKYPKSSGHIRQLYKDRTNEVYDYLHKMTRAIADYCASHQIHTVVIGDLTGIRKDNDKGHVTNQKLHALPYKKIYTMLEYKLARLGIKFIMRVEAYSSQCSPLAPEVSIKYAHEENRVFRGLYRDGDHAWNADVVGAYNILRLYLGSIGKGNQIPEIPESAPVVLKVAV